jgi:hypothetical protein
MEVEVLYASASKRSCTKQQFSHLHSIYIISSCLSANAQERGHRGKLTSSAPLALAVAGHFGDAQAELLSPTQSSLASGTESTKAQRKSTLKTFAAAMDYHRHR